MWLAFNNAFVSVVQDKENNPNGKYLLVRARKRKHLQRMLGKSAKIVETPNRDYRWRARVKRDTLSWIMDWHCQNLTYTNFKDSVKEHDLHDMYANWWSDHYRMQMRDMGVPADAYAPQEEDDPD
jgi:hypothetical protein